MIQRMVGYCSKILRACTVFFLKGPAKDSKQHPYLPLTLHAPLDLLNRMTQVVEQFTVVRIHCRGFSCLHPTQNKLLLSH